MTLILIIAGLILKNAGPWFEDQAQVGGILLTVGLILLAIEVLAWLGFLLFANNKRKHFR